MAALPSRLCATASSRLVSGIWQPSGVENRVLPLGRTLFVPCAHLTSSCLASLGNLRKLAGERSSNASGGYYTSFMGCANESMLRGATGGFSRGFAAAATTKGFVPGGGAPNSTPQWDDALIPRSWKHRWRKKKATSMKPDDILSRAAVQSLMRHGRRAKALRVYMDALKSLKAQWRKEDGEAAPTQTGLNGTGQLPKSRQTLACVAMERSMPALETKGVRVGANRLQVPKICSSHRSRFLGLSFLQKTAQGHLKTLRGTAPKQPPPGKGGASSRWLANTWRETLRGEGGALQKRDDLHRLAEANRAYTHYRWW